MGGDINLSDLPTGLEIHFRLVAGTQLGVCHRMIPTPGQRLLLKYRVGVEKGTKAVISANSSVCGEQTFNNLRTNFVIEIP